MNSIMENEDYVIRILKDALNEAIKTSDKYPQPNYVCLKVAEEAGEIIKAAVHYTEGRGEWEEVEKESIQTIAMIIRLLTEGDEVNGIVSPKKRYDT